jgi:hypothetical protein
VTGPESCPCCGYDDPPSPGYSCGQCGWQRPYMPASESAVPVERLRAMIRLLWPDEITPTAKRQLESLCEQYEVEQ